MNLGNLSATSVPSLQWDLVFKTSRLWAGIPQSVQRLAKDQTVLGSNAGGGEFFHTRQTGPGNHLPPVQWEFFPGGKSTGA